MAIIELLNEKEATVKTKNIDAYTHIKKQIEFLNNYKNCDRIQARVPYELIVK